jgi:tetratricopeptide (TPR) repeat protein
MKAFFSHSSRDKTIVEEIANLVGGAYVELDSFTFDRGALTVEAIDHALKRSTLFVLFLTRDAIDSKIVKFEALLARELIARGLLTRFLVICLDEDAFIQAEECWKTYSFVRRPISPQSTARAIISELLISNSGQSTNTHPFVGRGNDLAQAKGALARPGAEGTRAIYISGLYGIGRRTFAQHLLHDVYPHLNRVLPEIALNALDGYEEIFRHVFARFAPFETLSQKRLRITNFSTANNDEKARLIAQQIERLIEARESIIVVDRGGLLDDSGGFQLPLRNILRNIRRSKHPAIIIVAERMVPPARRNDIDGAIFARLNVLHREDIRQLIALLLRGDGVKYNDDQLDRLIELSDGHPFNVLFMISFINLYSIDVLLADPEQLIQLKYKRSSQFIRSCEFSETEKVLLGVLKDFTTITFELACAVVAGEQFTVARALEKLIDLHIVEASEDTYTLSPPLRIAIERDSRFRLPPVERHRILRTLGAVFAKLTDNSHIHDSILDTGVLAALQADEPIGETFEAFLLPSHRVWLGRRRYDERRYDDCMRLMVQAIDDTGRLSPAGIVEACRFLCLAATRNGDEVRFERGIGALRTLANDPWAKSNVHFLLVFNARFGGEIPQAEENFRKSLEYSEDNFSSLRELATICKTRGDYESAERFARKALKTAEDNAYILDVMLSVLIVRNRGNYRLYEDEIDGLFERLRKSSDDGGKSFYATRRAEYKLARGEIVEACRMIDEAVQETPGIFDVHLLRAIIYLERGNISVVRGEIEVMENRIRQNTKAEGRSNLRHLLDLNAAVHVAVGEFDEARRIYENSRVYSPAEAARLTKEVDREQAYRTR